MDKLLFSVAFFHDVSEVVDSRAICGQQLPSKISLSKDDALKICDGCCFGRIRTEYIDHIGRQKVLAYSVAQSFSKALLDQWQTLDIASRSCEIGHCFLCEHHVQHCIVMVIDIMTEHVKSMLDIEGIDTRGVAG